MAPLDAPACEALYTSLTPLREGAGDYVTPPG
jgi:hypothetical protein